MDILRSTNMFYESIISNSSILNLDLTLSPWYTTTCTIPTHHKNSNHLNPIQPPNIQKLVDICRQIITILGISCSVFSCLWLISLIIYVYIRVRV